MLANAYFLNDFNNQNAFCYAFLLQVLIILSTFAPNFDLNIIISKIKIV